VWGKNLHGWKATTKDGLMDTWRGIGPVNKPDCEATNQKEEMVEIPNQYFGSVFTHEDTSSVHDWARTASIHDVEFNLRQG